MERNIKELNIKLQEVTKLGWVKSLRKGDSGVGYTLEQLIGNQENKLPIGDYLGIEIKAKRIFKKSRISLFNAAPDGEYLFETARIRDTYGYPDSKGSNKKVFNVSIWANKRTNIGYKYSYKLKVDKDSRKIFFQAFNKLSNKIDNQTFWSFELLEEKINVKLKLLALVDALYSKENDDEYFKYNNISFYRFKNFNTFVDLIEKGVIRVTFKLGVYRAGPRIGNTHDYGTSFDISEDDLPKLYDSLAL